MPDLDTLRRWLKRELPAEESREVSKWVIRATDPSVGVALHALSREIEEEAKESHQLDDHPETRPAIALWTRLLDLGKAHWEQPRQGQPIAASLSTGGAHKAPLLHLVGDDTSPGANLELTVVVARRASVTLLATTEQGYIHVLVEPTTLKAGTHPSAATWTLVADEGEVTFWLVSSSDAHMLSWAVPGLSWQSFEQAVEDDTLTWMALRAESD